MSKETPQQKVQRMILERSKASEYCRRLFLPKDEYMEFYRAVEPEYKKQYGAIVAEQEALKDGYENILFDGWAVCCE